MASQQPGGNPFRRTSRTSGTGQPPGRPQQPGTELGARRGQKIRDMGPTIIPDKSILNDVSPTVLDLSVQDLSDLADELSGLDSHNPSVKSLRAQDLQDIEAIFYEPRARAFQARGGAGPAGGVGAEIFDNWSCCCCTPCCSCAATETDPFEDPGHDEM